MKKLKGWKKFFAGLLMLTLLIQALPMQAMADDPKLPTIDTTKKGSLTIHKYEYNKPNGANDISGTGASTDSIPQGANPLAGAGFTIYKVADAEDLKNYYSTNPTDLPNVDTYLDTTDKTKIASAYADKQVGNELKTNTDGTATFSNLDVGLYVVIETTTPPAVTQPCAPFIISVPMTTADGSSWLYNVHVFPKNGTSYGKIDLEKKDEKTNAVLQGIIFKLEKKNSDNTWTEITKKAGAQGDNTGDTLNLTTDTDGKISVDGLSQGTYRFTETGRGDNNGYIIDKKTPYEFVVTKEGKVTYNGETKDVVTIPVTNAKPELDKDVKKSDGTTWSQDADYSVGDKVPYRLVIYVPSNITELKDFAVTDTPHNLKDIIDSDFTVKYGNSADAASTDVVVGAYTKAATTETTSGKGDTGFKITFTPSQMGDYAGKYIVISYQAELLSSAVVTTTGNPNTAKLEYSNEIKPGSDTTTPGKDYIEDTAVVYTFEIDVIKKAESATGDPLKDVEFDLYKETTSSDTNAIMDDDAKNVGLDNAKKWVKINSAPLKTDADGKIAVQGLAYGKYYLVETKTNASYNLLKAPVEVTLNISYTTTTKDEYYVDNSGEKKLIKHEVSSTTFNPVGGTSGNVGLVSQTIINKKGFTLPTTGGIGTFVFVFAGIALMAAAVILFITSKKKEKVAK